jgi:hypothetical protein
MLIICCLWADTILDDFAAVEEIGGCSISARINVEGASELVIKRASQALQDVQFIFIEVKDAEFWTSQWRSSDVMDHLMTKGLCPVARDFE